MTTPTKTRAGKKNVPATAVRQNDTGTATIVGFDYEQLSHGVAAVAREAADRIRSRLSNSLIDTGKDLRLVRERLEHGQFGAGGCVGEDHADAVGRPVDDQAGRAAGHRVDFQVCELGAVPCTDLGFHGVPFLGPTRVQVSFAEIELLPTELPACGRLWSAMLSGVIGQSPPSERERRWEAGYRSGLR